jgi:hypothetical protein
VTDTGVILTALLQTAVAALDAIALLLAMTEVNESATSP